VNPDPQDPGRTLLVTALTQTSGLLARVGDHQLGAATPCAEWAVAELVDHLVNAPTLFATVVRGEEPDWEAAPEHVGADRVARFDEAADGLLDAWRAVDGSARQASPLQWQLAELAVHGWDLATAIGESTATLDPEVAEQGLAFMRGALTVDNRGEAFAPEQPAPDDADAYARIAAFAGRWV
jgi:uncharacterized protein (TIGR03086 family)